MPITFSPNIYLNSSANLVLNTSISAISGMSICKKIENIWAFYKKPSEVKIFDCQNTPCLQKDQFSLNFKNLNNFNLENSEDCFLKAKSQEQRARVKFEKINETHIFELDHLQNSLFGTTDYNNFLNVLIKNPDIQNPKLIIERAEENKENLKFVFKNDQFSIDGDCKINLDEGVCDSHLKYKEWISDLSSSFFGNNIQISWKKRIDWNGYEICKIEGRRMPIFSFLFSEQRFNVETTYHKNLGFKITFEGFGKRHLFSSFIKKIRDAYYVGSEIESVYDGLSKRQILEFNSSLERLNLKTTTLDSQHSKKKHQPFVSVKEFHADIQETCGKDECQIDEILIRSDSGFQGLKFTAV